MDQALWTRRYGPGVMDQALWTRRYGPGVDVRCKGFTVRILLATDTYLPQVNGVAKSVQSLARALTDRGHRVLVYTLAHPSDALLANRDDFPVVRLPSVQLPFYSDFSIASPVGFSLASIVGSFQPHILHCHTPYSVGLRCLRAAEVLGVAALGTHHTLIGDYIACYSQLGETLNRKLAHLVRHYVTWFYNQVELMSCASRFIASDLLASGLTRPVTIVPNAVNDEWFQLATGAPLPQADSQAFRLVFFGRLAPEKGLDRLLALVCPLLRRHPHARFDIVGDGPVRAKLEQQVRESGLGEQITFTGFLHGNDLRRRVASSQVFVSASLTENQPISMLESLACGVPVVALAAAGVPEIICEGVNGYLVDPYASPDVFSDRIERLVENDALRATLALGARSSAQAFTTGACVRATERAYEQTLLSARRRGVAFASWTAKG